MVVDRVATLAWLAQEAAIELHPWTATIEAPDRPRYALIDIDPGEATTWDEVLVLARLFRTALEHLGVIGLPKTTGKRGLQVWIPIADRYTFDQTRDWIEGLSRAVGQIVPDLVSWAWTKRDRRGRARLDYTQNAPIRTLVAPYSARPAAGAPVSTPDQLGRARGPGSPSGPVDGPHPAATPGGGGGPVRPGADPAPGSAAAGLRHEDATADVQAVASSPRMDST